MITMHTQHFSQSKLIIYVYDHITSWEKSNESMKKDLRFLYFSFFILLLTTKTTSYRTAANTKAFFLLSLHLFQFDHLSFFVILSNIAERMNILYIWIWIWISLLLLFYNIFSVWNLLMICRGVFWFTSYRF